MTPRPDPRPRSPGKAAQAALHLAQGRSIRATAAELGLNERTVRRWSKSARFRARVEELRSEATGQTLALLAAFSAGAAVELARLMKESSSDAVRLGAARAILDRLPDFDEYQSLAERVRELERSQRAREGQDGKRWG